MPCPGTHDFRSNDLMKAPPPTNLGRRFPLACANTPNSSSSHLARPNAETIPQSPIRNNHALIFLHAPANHSPALRSQRFRIPLRNRPILLPALHRLFPPRTPRLHESSRRRLPRRNNPPQTSRLLPQRPQRNPRPHHHNRRSRHSPPLWHRFAPSQSRRNPPRKIRRPRSSSRNS